MGSAAAGEQWGVVEVGEEVRPTERAAEADDRREVGLRVLLDRESACEQVRVILAEPDDLALLRGGNKVGGQALLRGTPTAPFRTGRAAFTASGSPDVSYLGVAANPYASSLGLIPSKSPRCIFR